MKVYYKIAISIVILISLVIVFGFMYYHHKPVLTENQALKMIYGNYDDSSKSAHWNNIPFPDNDFDSYFKERKGLVKTIFFQSYLRKW